MPKARRDGPFDGARPVLLLCALAGLLLVVAAAATPDGLPFVRHLQPAQVVVPDTPAIADYLLVALCVALVVAALILRAIAWRRQGAEEPAQGPWWARVVAFAAWLVLLKLLVTSSLAQRTFHELALRFRGRRMHNDVNPRAGHHLAQATSRPLGIALTIVIALLLAAAVAAIVFLVRKERGDAPPREDEAGDFRLTVDASIDDLLAIEDPRKAVIACYARMEAFVASSGIIHLSSDTPLEFFARVLSHHHVPHGAVERLTGLFEVAKFSSHPVTDQMRREALKSLRDVRGVVANA